MRDSASIYHSLGHVSGGQKYDRELDPSLVTSKELCRLPQQLDKVVRALKAPLDGKIKG